MKGIFNIILTKQGPLGFSGSRLSQSHIMLGTNLEYSQLEAACILTSTSWATKGVGKPTKFLWGFLQTMNKTKLSRHYFLFLFCSSSHSLWRWKWCYTKRFFLFSSFELSLASYAIICKNQFSIPPCPFFLILLIELW